MNVELAYLAQNAVVEVSARLMQMHLLQMEILVKNLNNFQKVIVGFPQVQESKTRLLSLSFARVCFCLNTNQFMWVSFHYIIWEVSQMIVEFPSTFRIWDFGICPKIDYRSWHTDFLELRGGGNKNNPQKQTTRISSSSRMSNCTKAECRAFSTCIHLCSHL